MTNEPGDNFNLQTRQDLKEQEQILLEKLAILIEELNTVKTADSNQVDDNSDSQSGQEQTDENQSKEESRQE